MAFAKEYTPCRRMAMTVVMWLIFAATAGLAALATKYPAQPPEAAYHELEQLEQWPRGLHRLTTQPR